MVILLLILLSQGTKVSVCHTECLIILSTFGPQCLKSDMVILMLKIPVPSRIDEY